MYMYIYKNNLSIPSYLSNDFTGLRTKDLRQLYIMLACLPLKCCCMLPYACVTQQKLIQAVRP